LGLIRVSIKPVSGFLLYQVGLVQGFRVPTRPDWVGSVGLIDQVGFGSGGAIRPGWVGSGVQGSA